MAQQSGVPHARAWPSAQRGHPDPEKGFPWINLFRSFALEKPAEERIEFEHNCRVYVFFRLVCCAYLMRCSPRASVGLTWQAAPLPQKRTGRLRGHLLSLFPQVLLPTTPVGSLSGPEIPRL